MRIQEMVGWHSGTMRQRIGKELVSHGIDNANYGLNSTAGLGENSHPYVVAQLAAHNSRGNYANGIQVHGGSGGGGIVTLDSHWEMSSVMKLVIIMVLVIM